MPWPSPAPCCTTLAGLGTRPPSWVRRCRRRSSTGDRSRGSTRTCLRGRCSDSGRGRWASDCSLAAAECGRGGAMLLKLADDKSKRVSLLEDLQKSTLLDARQKKWLREELGRLRKGIQGEQ